MLGHRVVFDENGNSAKAGRTLVEEKATAGPVCTGTLIAATHADNCQATYSGGEGYTGPVCTPPAGDQTTIVMDLKSVPTDSEPPAEMCSANAPTR
jgi:hypothetical protein